MMPDEGPPVLRGGCMGLYGPATSVVPPGARFCSSSGHMRLADVLPGEHLGWGCTGSGRGAASLCGEPCSSGGGPCAGLEGPRSPARLPRRPGRGRGRLWAPAQVQGRKLVWPSGLCAQGWGGPFGSCAGVEWGHWPHMALVAFWLQLKGSAPPPLGLVRKQRGKQGRCGRLAPSWHRGLREWCPQAAAVLALIFTRQTSA